MPAAPPPGEAPLINACYSLIAPDYGISVTEVYRINGDRIAAVQQAGGTSALAAGPDTRRAESEYARSLYRNLVRDSFGSDAAPG